MCQEQILGYEDDLLTKKYLVKETQRMKMCYLTFIVQ